MVKVRTARPACCRMSATTSDESMPPERKAPSGTSAIRRELTIRANSSRNSSRACARSSSGRSRAASAISTADQ